MFECVGKQDDEILDDDDYVVGDFWYVEGEFGVVLIEYVEEDGGEYDVDWM